MTSKLDLGLSDIIASNKSTTRSSDTGSGSRGGRGSSSSSRGGRGGRGSSRGGRGSSSGRDSGRSSLRNQPYTTQRQRDSRRQDPDAEFSQRAPPASTSTSSAVTESKVRGDTVFVSNLDKDVNQEDVYDIFSRVGSVRTATVNYDQSGTSLGTAEVTFNTSKDAETAVREYDGAEVDGRVMNVKLIGSFVRAPQIVKKQTASAPQTTSTTTSSRGRGGRRQRDITNTGKGRGGATSSRGTGSRGGRGGSLRGRRGGRGRGRGGAKPTAESLDAELDAYTSSRSEGK